KWPNVPHGHPSVQLAGSSPLSGTQGERRTEYILTSPARRKANNHSKSSPTKQSPRNNPSSPLPFRSVPFQSTHPGRTPARPAGWISEQAALLGLRCETPSCSGATPPWPPVPPLTAAAAAGGAFRLRRRPPSNDARRRRRGTAGRATEEGTSGRR
uniref:Uncharacterized protein n=1 Tax=Aegilops tauschii subsp. strangulata TaxID=200361 RepID=A0A453S295_AEGTS